VHAGWRGTVAAVARRAVESLVSHYGAKVEELRALLGPSIDACCYQVGAAVGEAFRQQWGRLPRSYRSDRGEEHKAHLDLRDANIEMLGAAGVLAEHIERLGPCTACAADRFFSHRALQGICGRQAGLIGWQQL